MQIVVLAALSIFAGAIASVTGFGIGSILTPYLALTYSTKLAIALVAIPHFVATFLRFWMMRRHIDRKTLLSFGLMSAAGGLVGALLHNALSSEHLTLIFGVLLIVSGLMGITGLARRVGLRGLLAYVVGGLSGLFGGMVGNQGGIRTAGLLAFDLPKAAFVATATAVGVIVDLARMPVYIWQNGSEMMQHVRLIALAAAGTLIGTIVGARLLRHIPEATFRLIVSSIVLLLGIYMLGRGLAAG